MRILALLPAAAAAVVLAACGASPPDQEAGSSSTPLPEGGTYVVQDYSFDELLVRPGQVVSVTNADDEPHTVTAEDGSFDTGPFDKADPARFTAPVEVGTYEFTCTVHPSMQGTLTVR